MAPIFSRFGADFFTVYADFSRFIRDINGEKKKTLVIDDFFTVSFSRFAPSRVLDTFPPKIFMFVGFFLARGKAGTASGPPPEAFTAPHGVANLKIWSKSLSPKAGHNKASRSDFSTPNMTGRRFHRTMDMIPACPW